MRYKQNCMASPPEVHSSLSPARAHRALEVLLAGSVLAISFGLCIPALRLHSTMLTRSEFYGHAYAIPAVAAYLVFQKRTQIRGALHALRPPRLGPLVVFGVGMLEVLMVMGDVGFGAALGIPVVLGAAAYAIGGMPLLRPLGLPLMFLVFMVPPPHFLRYQLLFGLKLAVTQAAVSLLQFGGQTVAAEGNQILVPGHTLFVADACSGFTSIVTLLPLACIVAYFLSRGVWRRLLVVASVVPLAVGANVIRVIGTVLLVSSIGMKAAEGLLHESFGIATYVLGTLFLLGVARVLR